MQPEPTMDVSPEDLEQLAVSTPPPSPSADDGSGVEVCPNCLNTVDYCDNLCPHCGGQVSSNASLMPWEGTLARGFAFRQAVGKPRTPLILIGVWLIFFPELCFAAMLVVKFMATGVTFDPIAIGVAVSGVISAAVLYQTTRNYFRPLAAGSVKV